MIASRRQTPAESRLSGKIVQTEGNTGPLAVLTGTRPGIIKFSPILRELERRGTAHILIHSGQHYSPEMDAVFFEELGLRAPDYKLDVVRHFPLHGEQTAEMLRGIERILIERRPWMLLVGGDCNTHLAGALAGRKLHIPLGHVEAGMRGYDWRVPEEHNRVMIDHISEYLFVHDVSAQKVLERENVRGAIHIVGTSIADAVIENAALAAARSTVLGRNEVEPGRYLLATTHRQENVDDPDAIRCIFRGLEAAAVAHGLPVVLPLHPRTRKRLAEFGVDARDFPRVRLIEPQGYLDFLNLVATAATVVTDSGGVQQESCILGVPCVTLRPTTEWTETIAIGANRLADLTPDGIAAAVSAALASARAWSNPFPDGAARRLVDVLEQLDVAVHCGAQA